MYIDRNENHSRRGCHSPRKETSKRHRAIPQNKNQGEEGNSVERPMDESHGLHGETLVRKVTNTIVLAHQSTWSEHPVFNNTTYLMFGNAMISSAMSAPSTMSTCTWLKLKTNTVL